MSPMSRGSVKICTFYVVVKVLTIYDMGSIQKVWHVFVSKHSWPNRKGVQFNWKGREFNLWPHQEYFATYSTRVMLAVLLIITRRIGTEFCCTSATQFEVLIMYKFNPAWSADNVQVQPSLKFGQFTIIRSH